MGSKKQGKKKVRLPWDSSRFDYVLMTDADQLFVWPACEDLLGIRVVLQHPQYFDKAMLCRTSDSYDPTRCPDLLEDGEKVSQSPSTCKGLKQCMIGGPYPGIYTYYYYCMQSARKTD